MPSGKDFDDIDVDTGVTAALGVDIRREILGVERWTARRLVADHYCDGNVFLAGDAAHLAWLLSAVFHGWAGPHLLDAYETERCPIGDMVSNAAVGIMKNRGPAMAVADGLESEGVEGERRAAGARIVAADASQFNIAGVQLAYYHDNSPINWNDGSPRLPLHSTL